MKKRIKQIGLYTGVILLAWTLVGVSSGYRKARPCVEFRVVLKNQQNNYFLGLEDVRNLMREANGKPLEGSMMGEIKVSNLEYSLRTNPYVRGAEVWKDVTCNLIAEVELRRPIARIEPDGRSGYYLDETWTRVPLSDNFSANTVLVTGAIPVIGAEVDSIPNDEFKSVLEMLSFIDRDEFLKAQVSEVVIDSKGEITIYPEVGNTPIEFGKPDRMEEKFSNLMLFYRKVLNRKGWSAYKKISLKYKGQIVAEKR